MAPKGKRHASSSSAATVSTTIGGYPPQKAPILGKKMTFAMELEKTLSLKLFLKLNSQQEAHLLVFDL